MGKLRASIVAMWRNIKIRAGIKRLRYCRVLKGRCKPKCEYYRKIKPVFIFKDEGKNRYHVNRIPGCSYGKLDK